MLVGRYRGDKILLATPLLRWYLDHGLEVLYVYQVIEYDPIPCFRRFSDAVSTARREGDVHRDKTIIADTMKLLENSGYGKTITNVDRHRDTEKAASLMVNDRSFRQLDTWDSSFYSTPRWACCSFITTSSTNAWSALCSSTARWIQIVPIWPWPVSPSMPPRDPRTTRSLFPTSFRMAPVRMLRRTSERVRTLTTHRSTMGRGRGML